MNVSFSPGAWVDYLYWQTIDKKMVAKIDTLIKEMSLTPTQGKGNPEELRHQWTGWWSRRIDQELRLVYRVLDGTIQIAQCRMHY